MRIFRHPKRLLMWGIVFVFAISTLYGCSDTVKEIKLHARRASVQPIFYIPVLKISFSEPLAGSQKLTVEYLNKLLEEKLLTKSDIEKLLKEKELTYEKITKLLQERIKEALEKERKEQAEDRYSTSLTPVEKCFESPSATEIPLGTICPKWAKFPEKVLVVQRVEKKDIKEWEKEYEKDILAISELANVSPSKAKDIVSRLRIEGYAISKEEVDIEAEVKLLWFDDGWEDTYPIELNWKARIEGTKANIIIGYDPRGIIKVRPIPDGKMVCIEAGYFDLKSQYVIKSDEVKMLEYGIEVLKKDLERQKEESEKKEQQFQEEKEKLRKELEEKESKLREEKGETKRDISKATWMDIKFGIVKIEQFWMLTGATGVFLGNMQTRAGFEGWQSNWGFFHHNLAGSEKGVVLTNAHVAANVINHYVEASKDKEVMWIVYPGIPFIRYTQDSDAYGSPAQLLTYDQQPIMSHDYDCAIMVTTKVPQYEENRAILGNSDNIETGDSILMVGNPALYQKFSTEGIISNKNYDSWKHIQRQFKEVPRTIYNWIKNSCLWFDAPIGLGGTSGSGVWALEGSEKGKVIALHSMGLSYWIQIASAENDGKKVDINAIAGYEGKEDHSLFDSRDVNNWSAHAVLKKYGLKLFENYSYKDANFNIELKEFTENEKSFDDMAQKTGLRIDVTGMDSGIPINRIKAYLQERGLDPEHFGWKGLERDHYEK